MEKKNATAKIVIVVAAAVFICIDIFLFWCLRPARRIARIIDAGEKYFTEQSYKEALLYFRKAIAIDPKSIPAQLCVGKSAVSLAENAEDLATKEKYYQEAEDAYKAVMVLDANNEEALSGMDNLYVDWSNVYIGNGDYDAARALLSDAEKVYPTESKTLNAQRSQVETLSLEEKKKREGDQKRYQKYAELLEQELNSFASNYFSVDMLDMAIDADTAKAIQSFAVFDVDRDGHDELIFKVEQSVGMAGQYAEIFDYDPDKDLVTKEMGETLIWSDFTVYGNGTIDERYSHNQGMMVGSLYPYTLWLYDASKDMYVRTLDASSWSKESSDVDYNGDPFPTDIDKDGDGEIYLLDGNDTEQRMDGDDYYTWHDQQVNSTKPVYIPYHYCTAENIQKLRDQALDQSDDAEDKAPYVDALQSIATDYAGTGTGIAVNLNLSSGQCIDQGSYYELKDVKFEVPILYNSREEAIAAAGSDSIWNAYRVSKDKWGAYNENQDLKEVLYEGSVYIRKDADIMYYAFDSNYQQHYGVVNLLDFQSVIQKYGLEGSGTIGSWDENGYITALSAS